ncbi:MAG: hypothetical protein IJ717_08305 [Treponema sp.]|nr:hypothetical protein [Treponema sp.]
MLKALLKRFFPASFHKIERSEDKIITELRAEIMKLEKSIAELSIVAQKAEVNSWRAQQNAAEAVWANVFHDSISGEGFIKDKQFFPGRWAVGYPALYVIFRVLQNFRPKRILELGLGQSTRIIGQYAQSFPDVRDIEVLQYRNFSNEFAGKRFDFIFIDAPLEQAYDFFSEVIACQKFLF